MWSCGEWILGPEEKTVLLLEMKVYRYKHILYFITYDKSIFGLFTITHQHEFKRLSKFFYDILAKNSCTFNFNNVVKH